MGLLHIPPHISLHLPESPYISLHLLLPQVREMWGYCIAAASLGIKHRVMDALQCVAGVRVRDKVRVSVRVT